MRQSKSIHRGQPPTLAQIERLLGRQTTVILDAVDEKLSVQDKRVEEGFAAQDKWIEEQLVAQEIRILSAVDKRLEKME